MELTMYDTLLQLPLFQGLCKEDVTRIIGKVKLRFHKHLADVTIVEQGESCGELIFLLNGELYSRATDEQGTYSLYEVFSSPFVVEPYSLFGMKTCYTATYKARTDVSIVSIDKQYVVSELNNYEIFRLNYLNILSNRAQMIYERLWNIRTGTPWNKIVNFLMLRVARQEGEKRLKIKMEDLATLVDETRINVSHALNNMQERGLVRLSRKEIQVISMEKLMETVG